MEKFTTHTGVGVPLRRSNVDTDQIIPAVYLKRVTRTGFEDGLFAAWRNDPDFVLNHPTYAAGSVLVVDAGGAQHGHWGEVLAVAAQQRGIVGLLIDGGVRDRDEQGQRGFPVFSRNDSILGTTKSYPGVLGQPVVIGGITVATGDLVVGDTDGVVAVPRLEIDRVLAAADARVAHEQDVFVQLLSGATTVDLYDLRRP